TEPPPPEISTLSLHDALPICRASGRGPPPAARAPASSDRPAADDGRSRRGRAAPRRRAARRDPPPPPAGRWGSPWDRRDRRAPRSEEHTSELQSRSDLVCRLL